MQRGHALWTSSMGMQHGDMDMKHRHAAWARSMDMQHKYAAWACGVDMQHARRTCSIDMQQAKLGNRSDEAMKRCDEALNASLLQFLCQR